MPTEEKWLRTAFAAGAVTDGIALLPMLVPPLASLLWGFDEVSRASRFALRPGASSVAKRA